MDKSQLRSHYRAVRESLSPAQVTAASAALCSLLATWPRLRQASTVLSYIAFRNELDLTALCSLAPDVQWTVPRVVGKRLVCHAHDPDR